MLCSTACAAALERSSTGRMTTWLRTPTRPFSRLKPKKVAFERSCIFIPPCLPTLGFHVMDMQMLALRNGLHHLADVHAVLDYGVARLVVAQRDLVADRDVALRLHFDVFVVFHDPAGERLPGLHALDHDDANAVAFLVHHEMNHSAAILIRCSIAAAS